MRWIIRLVAALIALALLAGLGYALVRGFTDMLANVDLNAGERDPMFAEEEERIERPAELDEEEPQPEHPTLDDYVPEVESPVDMTVEELIREAEKVAQENEQLP